LEPCNHTGRTPPCTEAIIAAGIRRGVIGAHDPNPHVAGGGAARLRQAGIEVVEGVEGELCRRLIAPFAFHAATGRAFVTVKRAFDEAGSMIPPVGHKVFTSEASLVLAHRLRRKADAIVTGSGTILADRPLFTVRHVDDHAGKRRILAILDRRGRVDEAYLQQARENGMEPVIYTDIAFCLHDLAARGARDILVEAGTVLSDAVLASPHWTMRVDIHKGMPDRINVAFHPHQNVGFDVRGVGLSDILL
jgi:diaminohydroxyphosphoribosylaminopyrimidine deaminase/5-amino-6-(5-phosphoribosylamino)uracil reductase